MRLNEGELQQLYQSMTARRARQGDDCVDEDLLIHAASGELTDAARSKIAAHIATCSDCARDYRIARSLRTFENEGRRALGSATTRARWWAVAASVVFALLLSAVVWLSVTDKRKQETIRHLETTVASQQSELEVSRRRPVVSRVDAMRPQLGVPIVDLDDDAVRGPGDATTSINVPSSTQFFTVILHLPKPVRKTLEIELFSSDGSVLWRDRLKPDSSTTVTLAVPRSLVPAGDYTIEVGSADSRMTFRFRVQYR